MSVTHEQFTRLCALFLASLVAAILVFGALSFGSLVWDEQAEIAEVERLVSRIATESAAVTDAYFAEAERATDLATTVLEAPDPTVGTGAKSLNVALGEITISQPNVVATFAGFPDGSFVLTRRDPKDPERLIFKSIEMSPTRLVTETTVRVSGFEHVAERQLPDDTYDPRRRQWYRDAVSQMRDDRPDCVAAAAWSDPYTFFSTQLPGVTYGRSVCGADGQLTAVVGADLELADLTAFLEERKPSPYSQVTVSNEVGTEIARTSDADIRLNNSSESVALARKAVTRSDEWFLTIEASHDDFLVVFRAEQSRYQRIILVIAGLLSAFVVFGALAFTNHLNRLRLRSETDDLTGLPNRRTIIAHLAEALERQRYKGVVALMIIDLDGFKAVNDTYGHVVGDSVLQLVAERAQHTKDPHAMVGRLGSDEFCVVYSSSADSVCDDLAAYTTRLMNDLFSEPLIEGSTSRSSGAGGCARQLAGEAKTVTELFFEADVALYMAKQQSSTVPVIYSPGMEIPGFRDLARKEELISAIEAGELAWHFQPEVDLRDNRLVGAEALIRWHHRVHGELAADRFIGDLERLGLLGRLLPAMLDASVEFSRPYRDVGFTIRINLAFDQLRSQEAIALLHHANEASPGVTVCVEITERSFVDPDADTVRSLEWLRSSGIRVVLDDFGTEFSSLKELHDLPVDGIKVDRTFVASLHREDPRKSIAAMMVDLGGVMELEVVAEGIETADQAALLLDLGCIRGQGFLFGPAVPREEFWARLPVIQTADA